MSNNQLINKVPLSGRLSYGLTDGCGNLLYCIIGSYLLYFYTDVFGLSVATAGAILLFTRLLDAIDAQFGALLLTILNLNMDNLDHTFYGYVYRLLYLCGLHLLHQLYQVQQK